MTDTVWSVLAGIVAGVFAGSISARISVNRLGHRLSGGSQMASDSAGNQRDHGVVVRDHGQFAKGRRAKNVGRDENNFN